MDPFSLRLRLRFLAEILFGNILSGLTRYVLHLCKYLHSENIFDRRAEYVFDPGNLGNKNMSDG